MQSRAAQLDKQIKVLIDDSVALLKTRMVELGINASCSTDLLSKAKEIVIRHKELQGKVAKLQSQVSIVFMHYIIYSRPLITGLLGTGPRPENCFAG